MVGDYSWHQETAGGNDPGRGRLGYVSLSECPSLGSCAGMCPENNESADKRLSGRTRKGSP